MLVIHQMKNNSDSLHNYGVKYDAFYRIKELDLGYLPDWGTVS